MQKPIISSLEVKDEPTSIPEAFAPIVRIAKKLSY
jgi:hypothetical protein